MVLIDSLHVFSTYVVWFAVLPLFLLLIPLPDERFEKPDLEIDPLVVKPALRGFWQGNENFFIDKISGKLAGEFTPEETRQEKADADMEALWD